MSDLWPELKSRPTAKASIQCCLIGCDFGRGFLLIRVQFNERGGVSAEDAGGEEAVVGRENEVAG